MSPWPEKARLTTGAPGPAQPAVRARAQPPHAPGHRTGASRAPAERGTGPAHESVRYTADPPNDSTFGKVTHSAAGRGSPVAQSEGLQEPLSAFNHLLTSGKRREPARCVCPGVFFLRATKRWEGIRAPWGNSHPGPEDPKCFPEREVSAGGFLSERREVKCHSNDLGSGHEGKDGCGRSPRPWGSSGRVPAPPVTWRWAW